MASVVYPKGKQNFSDANIDWLTDTIKVILIDTGNYTYNAAHDALNDVAGAARVATSGALAGKSNTDGVHDANDVLFSAVSGATIEALIIYKDSGLESTSWLIAYIDNAGEFPVTPNGMDIDVRWDNGANKIFAL